MAIEASAEINDILRHYDLGELVNFEKNERGYVNTSFALETMCKGERKKLFFRRYKTGVREEELQFEHSLIRHLSGHGSPPVAKVYSTDEGKTYVIKQESNEDPRPVFYAIFDFLPGDDRYTWINPKCSDLEVVNAAAAMAQFHAMASDLTPQGDALEAKILELLPQIEQNILKTPQRSKKTVFDGYLLENMVWLVECVQHNLSRLSQPDARQMIQTIVHCDYHPGNLKFQGSQVSGLFDFDWSKIDARCFDMGLALWYFFSEWEGERDGEVYLDPLRLYLSSYQKTMQSTRSSLSLDATELSYLPDMIQAGNLYILNWTIEDFYHKEVDPQEYLIYLRHSVNSARWLEDPDHHDRLQAVLIGLK